MANNYKPEEIERRRKLAQDLVKQGKFGGKQPGSGRPATRRRAAQQAAEALDKNIKGVIEALEKGISEDSPTALRVATAEKWLEIERREAELNLKEDKQYDQMSANELMDAILSKFLRIKAGGAEFDIEGTATEVVPLELGDGDDE